MSFRRLIVLHILTASAAVFAGPAVAATEGGSSAARGVAAVETAVADCSVTGTRGCVAGRTLRVRNRMWRCTRPLSRYGRLPLKVVVSFARGRRFAAGGIDLYTGCAGDGDPSTIDLIVDVKGNGRTHGPGADAFKVRREAGYRRGIQVTGRVDCGPRYSSAGHQDGVQLQGGRDITFVDFRVGRYGRGRSTCQGAGGAFFASNAANIEVVRGRYIACNRGLLMGGRSTGSVRRAKIRSGRTDGSDPVCRGYHGSRPCDAVDGVTLTRVTCQRWNARRDRWAGG
jgi:hypothetical protein